MASKRGKKYAKSETGSKRGRYVTMVERFAQIENINKRVKMPGRVVILDKDLKVIESLSKRRKISRSAAFEYIVWCWYSRGLYRHFTLLDSQFNRRLKSKEALKNIPRFTIHPCTLFVLREYAKSSNVSLSVAIHRFIFTFREVII